MAKYLLFVILLTFFYSGTSHADSSVPFNKIKKTLLTNKQINLLHEKAAKEVPECRFIYRKAPVGSIKKDEIYGCIESWDFWFLERGKYEVLGHLAEKTFLFNTLDNGLGNKVKPYILGLPKTDQAKLLRDILNSHSDDLIFIQSMIDHGISVEKVLLAEIGAGGAGWASCDSYMLLLNKNIALYQNDKTLYEPVPDADEEMKGSMPSYRLEDIHHLADPYYTVCPEAIEWLVRVNPELPNKKGDIGYYGSTPLHLFLGRTYMRKSSDIKIINNLITPTNINMKTDYGDTPLHEFLTNKNLDSLENKKKIVKMMISRGANINIKNNEGITVKDLMLKQKLYGISGHDQR
jgi:hypothetical protein